MFPAVPRRGTTPTGPSQGHLRSDTSDGVVAPSVDQLKALLQLKDSSPDEFLKLVESTRGVVCEKTGVRRIFISPIAKTIIIRT